LKKFKITFLIVTLLIFGMVISFFLFSDSYKLSFEARMKYFMGDYKTARELAQKAFELDPYNKMAFSILAQSKISAKMVDYIEDANRYLKKIEELTKKSDFSHRDRIKIKMICEVMMARYDKLSPTVMTDKELYKIATRKYRQFRKIYEELF